MIPNSLSGRSWRCFTLLALAGLCLWAGASALAVPLPGDIDGNGKIDLADAFLSLRGVLGLQHLSPVQTQAADLNGDGRFTTADVFIELRLVLGLQPQVSMSVDAPVDGAYVRDAHVHVSGHARGPVTAVTINGTSAPVAGGSFASDVPLVSGTNHLMIAAPIPSGGAASVAVTVVQDSHPPSLGVAAPADKSSVNTATVSVSGTASDDSGHVSVTVNNVPVALAADGTFSAPVSLTDGGNVLKVISTDAAGNTSEQDINVRLFVSKPAAATGSDGTAVAFPPGALEMDLPVSVTPIPLTDPVMTGLPGGPLPSALRPGTDPSKPLVALIGGDRITVGDGTARFLKDPELTAHSPFALKPGAPVYLFEARPNPGSSGHTMLSLVDSMSVAADGRTITADPIQAGSAYPGFSKDTDAL